MMKISKSAMLAMIAPVVIGMAKKAGNKNEQESLFELNEQSIGEIDSFIHDSYILEDVYIVFDDGNPIFYLAFKTYDPIGKLRNMHAQSIWDELHRTSNLYYLSDIADFMINKVPAFKNADNVEGENFYFLPPNGRPGDNPVYFSVRSDGWIKSKRHYQDNGTFQQELFSQQQSEEQDPGINEIQNFDYLPNRLYWKPDPNLLPLFLMHGTSLEGMKAIGESGYLHWPSMALSWMTPARFGDIFFLFDPHIIETSALSYADRNLILYSSDSWSPTSGKVEIDRETFSQQRLEASIHYDEATDMEKFTELPEELDEGDLIGSVGGVSDYDVSPINTISDLIRELKQIMKYHTLNGRVVFRTRREQEEYARLIPDEVSDYGRTIRTSWPTKTYPYMEAKFMGKLGLKSVVAILCPRQYRNQVEEFIQTSGFSGDVLYYDVSDSDLIRTGFKDEEPRSEVAKESTRRLYHSANLI